MGLWSLLTTSVTAAIEEQLVNIRSLDPTIVVELRYAGARNIAGRALYPVGMPALVRSSVAQKLVNAQTFLIQHHYGLKVWDAYRPQSAQAQLWGLAKNTDYVSDPTSGLSLHTWGVAVDCTLVDEKGREVTMPTDFDSFTPAAMLRYQGSDQTIKHRLWVLQAAMGRNGFYGLRTEWWHFIAKNWKEFGPIREVTPSGQAETKGPEQAKESKVR